MKMELTKKSGTELYNAVRREIAVQNARRRRFIECNGFELCLDLIGEVTGLTSPELRKIENSLKGVRP